jgi:hypothetical protein
VAIALRTSFLLGDDGTAQTTSISGTVPGTAQAGDMALLCVVQGTGANTFTDPTGWTRLRSAEDRVNANLTTLLWAKKLLAADVGAAVTVTASGGARFTGAAVVFSGADTVPEIVVTEGQVATAATSITSPAITTPEPNCVIVNFWAVRSATIDPPSVTVPAGNTADGESNTANAAAPNFAVRASHRTAVAATAGSYAAQTATVSQASTAIVYSIALTPSTSATVNAGPDQVDVEPWTTVTLTGAVSGATVVSSSWTQTAGTAVTLTGSGPTRTFTAPGTIAGDTLTFTYSATNPDGATSSDSVTVTVLPVTERSAAGGVWVPRRLQELGGAPVEPPTIPDPGTGPVVPVPTPPSIQVGHEWTMWSRTASYGLGVALPIISARGVRRHMGVSSAICKTTYTAQRWAALQPSCGVVLYRDGRQEFTGLLAARQVEWDAGSGRMVIVVEAQGDTVHLSDRLVFPDPERAADDQTINDYWTSSAVATSTAMLKLISDQAGPTCRASRRVTGLTLGDDPGVGVVRGWKALFLPVLEQLTLMSVASGANLGLRITSETGALEVSVYQPRDLAGAIRFSADLSNLVGFTYREESPTATDAVAAGQGDLHLRLRKRAATTSALALAWGRRIWSYIDRRDTADAAELLQAATDNVTEGDATVSLAVTLTDSQAATYGRDWGLGDRITVYVGPPGQSTPVATVVDVVREIAFEVDERGAETLRPAIGTYDAKARVPGPTQRQLANVGVSLAGLIARK